MCSFKNNKRVYFNTSNPDDFPALGDTKNNHEVSSLKFSDIIMDENHSSSQENVPSEYVNLSKNKQNTIRRSHIEKINVDTRYRSIELLERNIDLSFEFEKNRYFHPYQQKYQDTFNNSDSESDLEEMDALT